MATKISLIFFFTFICFFVGLSQDKKRLYFKLEKGKYSKGMDQRIVSLKKSRLVTSYGFTIPCKCIGGGSLWFYSHDNPDTGVIFGPPRTISDKELKKIRFLSFEDLVCVMKQNDVSFNRLFILYFIELGEKNYMYHVYKGSNFADDAIDLIYLDSIKTE